MHNIILINQLMLIMILSNDEKKMSRNEIIENTKIIEILCNGGNIA